MPLPRAGTAGMVQYLNPSEPASRARLERSALFARKAAAAVGARFETQGWGWRDAKAAAEDARQEEGEGDHGEAYVFGFGLLALALAFVLAGMGVAWRPIAWHRLARRARSLGRDGGLGGPCVEMTQLQHPLQQQQIKQRQ